MKVKEDFVTNSSSSSFIVAFEKILVDFEDVKYLINREAKARQVLKDALSQKPVKIDPDSNSLLKSVTEELANGYCGLDYSKIQREFCEREGIKVNDLYKNVAWSHAFYQEYKAVEDRVCIKAAVEFLNKNEGRYLYIFNYGDEDGEFFSQMEHGFTFERVPHLTVSQH